MARIYLRLHDTRIGLKIRVSFRHAQFQTCNSRKFTIAQIIIFKCEYTIEDDDGYKDDECGILIFQFKNK